MAFASIESTVTAPVAKPTVANASRDDLEGGDTVLLNSVSIGSSYVWSLAYIPEGSAATFSGSEFDQSPGTFTVDQEGPYLIRLVMGCPTLTVQTTPIAAGATITITSGASAVLTAVSGARTSGANNFEGSLATPALIAAEIVAALQDPANSFTGIVNPSVASGSTQINMCPTFSGSTVTIVTSTSNLFVNATSTTEQFVRLRALTAFGALRLVAAGERVDTVPVPVDITFTGWADEQNFNLLTLLSFLQTTGSSGQVLYVDPNQGDFQTIQAAMDYAEGQGPTTASPWVVLVRPGLYEETLSFYDFVHVFGWPGGQGTSVVRIRNASTAAHSVGLPLAGSETTLSNLYFEQILPTTNPLLETVGPGNLTLHKCAFSTEGAGTPQGPAVDVGAGGTVAAFDSRFVTSIVASADSYSLTAQDGATLNLRESQVLSRGIQAGEATVSLRDCTVNASSEYAISCNGALTLDYSQVIGGTLSNIGMNPSGGAVAGDLISRIRWSQVGSLLFDITGVVGSTELSLGSSERGSLTTPGGAPATLQATTPSSTIFYDNAISSLTAENVQDALDEIWGIAIAVQTLDDAYNGGDPGITGSGRTINASAGSVQIVDAAAPSDPIPPSNPNGNLEVVGGVYVGAINKPEITIDPNPYGNGAEIRLGREIWAPDAPFGSTAFFLADASESPTFHNYNLRVGTSSATGGTQIGRAILRAGDSLASGVDAGAVYVQAGRGADAGGGNGGDLWLVPGDSSAGSVGKVWLARAQDGTPASLTAAGPFVGGVTGVIRFATDMGAIEVSIDAADNLAAVLAKFDATGFVTAVDSGGGVIQLTTAATGSTSEIFFLNADAGLDTALGGFAGQAQVNGTWPSRIDVEVSADGEITFGGSFANPMIYDANTGKLTVPGLIDPIGLVLDQTVPLTAGTDKGVLYIDDGSGPGNEGDLVYVYESGAVQNITAAVGGASGFAVEDEGILVPGGPHTALNFIGGGVVATDGGGGVANITVTAGGGGQLQGVQQDVFSAGSFTVAFPGATIALTQTLDTNALLTGMIVCYRNGVADMNNVGPAAPTTALEYRINGGNLEIGADITGTGHNYRLVYPHT